jgi:hypothetical protein
MRPSDYVEKLLGPIPESSLPKNEWQAHFLESETRNLVYMNGEDWVRKNRKFLLAQLSYIWSL